MITLLNRQFDRLGKAYIFCVYFFQAQFDKPRFFFCLTKPSCPSFTTYLPFIDFIYLYVFFLSRLIFLRSLSLYFPFQLYLKYPVGLVFTIDHFCWNDHNSTLWHLLLYMRACYLYEIIQFRYGFSQSASFNPNSMESPLDYLLFKCRKKMGKYKDKLRFRTWLRVTHFRY